MKWVVLAALAIASIGSVWADDPNEVPRVSRAVYSSLGTTKPETAKLTKIDAAYEKLLAKLRAGKPADYLVKRDVLNEKYTKDFMAALTPIEKSNYRKYIRSLRQAYRKAHPDVDADNIFIWGGANLL